MHLLHIFTFLIKPFLKVFAKQNITTISILMTVLILRSPYNFMFCGFTFPASSPQTMAGEEKWRGWILLPPHSLTHPSLPIVHLFAVCTKEIPEQNFNGISWWVRFAISKTRRLQSHTAKMRICSIELRRAYIWKDLFRIVLEVNLVTYENPLWYWPSLQWPNLLLG